MPEDIVNQEQTAMPTDLWPPLSLIRNALQSGGVAPESAVTLAQPSAVPEKSKTDLLRPLIELARRREAVVERAFTEGWMPGRLVSLEQARRSTGVLLDRRLPSGAWEGWLAVGEADWAGPFDVLLEPDDEPFEPHFGVIQTWNRVTVSPAPAWRTRVLGELSATRLAALRAVHDEWSRGEVPAIDPAPGQIGLRTAGGIFSVLSGTPLAERDPRYDYQSLYAEVAQGLSTAMTPYPGAAAGSASVPASAPGWLHRLRNWFGADRWVRPAFAVLALWVVVQNVGLLSSRDAEDEVRFRAVPAQSADAVDLTVRWKPGVGIDEAQRLLQSVSAEVVAGPDSKGTWSLRLPDPVGGLAVLVSSALVEAARPAPERP